MNYNEFKNSLIGKRVDVDHYPPKNPYQCADLVKKYLMDCFGVPNGSYGDAKDYWYKTHPAVLAKFEKVAGTPQQGDIVIVDAPVPSKHIAIADSSTKMLEQNGGSGLGMGTGTDAIRISVLPKNKIIGILRPKELIMQKYKVVFNDGKKKSTKELTPEAMKKSLERYYTDYAVYKRALGSVRVQLERLK